MSSTVLTHKLTSKKLSSANPENDSSIQKRKDKQNNSNFAPVLKKSNKTAHAFGPAYFHSVREAVFEVPYTPFLPQSIPEQLRLPDYQSEIFHPCPQCKDSFRFSSTLEEHMNRRSWILGYWCQPCFLGKCEHVPMFNPMCGNCVSAQFNRRSYLRSKGMKKGQKAAIIRIFYNQCAFFQHLQQHDITSVEISEVMLMPLPWDIKKEDYPKLEKACKAIMEYGFLNRIHIMEFLRDQKVESKWWDPPTVDENTNNYQVEQNLAGIIHTFRERDFVDSPVKKNSSNSNKNPSPANKIVPPANVKISTSNLNNSQIVSLPTTNNLSVQYFNSPYRPPADIAFVDCGPSHSVYKSHQSNPLLSPLPTLSPLSSSSNANNSLINSSTKSNQSQADSNQLLPPNTTANTSESTKELDSSGRRRNAFGQFIKQSTQPSSQPTTSVLTSTTSSNKVYTVSTCNTNTNSGPKISVKKFASEPVSNWAQCQDKIEKSQTTNVNTKILTVHSEKCLDISSIISQLPPDVINSKKIVFIEQNSNQINQYQKNSPQNTTGPTLSANCVKVNVPQGKKSQKTFPPAKSRSHVISQPVFKKTTKSLPNYPPKPAVNTVSLEPKVRASLTPIAKNSTGMKLQAINSYDGKIFYQSGKKFVIKQTNKIKSTSIPVSSVLKPNSQVRHVHNLIEIPTKSKTKILNKPVSNVITNSPLTPSTSPSELSTSSCDSLSKIFDDEMSVLKPYDNIKSRTDFNIKNLSESGQALLTIRVIGSKLFLHLMESLPNIKDDKSNMMKYKQNLLDTLPYLKTKDIQKRIDHINNISQEFLSAMKVSDDRIIDFHEQLIGQLTDSVEQAKILNIPQNIDDPIIHKDTMSFQQISQVFEIQHESDNKFLYNWEKQSMQKCSFCTKMKKPKNYLPGFSKLSANESIYCQCYNCLCSKCNTYQGTLTRFMAHKNYHAKTAPFVCPDCFRKFPTIHELEKHVWLDCFHPLMRNWFFGCKVCGIDGLTTVESLTQHFLLMHSKRGYVCSDCKEISFLESDYQIHLTSKHNDVLKTDNQLDMVEIVMCKIGNCIVLKENYTKHLIDHVGVEHQVFNKCPFCPFTKRHASRFVMEQFREHMFTSHSHLLTRYTSKDLINEVQKTLKANASSQEVLPMIINTRTIAREAFEKGTQDEDTPDRSISSMPMIVDVRSEAVNLNTNDDTMPKILEVKSIANDSLLKKSQESRKRKANTVIEITLSPKKISSVEIKNRKADTIDSKKITKKSTTIRGISQMKEILLEKRSLTRRNSADVEIIELEKSTDDSNVMDVDKTTNVGRDKEDIKEKDPKNTTKEKVFNEDRDNNKNNKEVIKQDNVSKNEEVTGDINKHQEEDDDHDKNKQKIYNNDGNVNKNKDGNDYDTTTNRKNKDFNREKKDEPTTDKRHSNEDKEDISRNKEIFQKAKENVSKDDYLDEHNQDVSKNNQNYNQAKENVNQRKEDVNPEEENYRRKDEGNDREEKNSANQGEENKHEQEDVNKENEVSKNKQICIDNENFVANKEDVDKNKQNIDRDITNIGKDNITSKGNINTSKNNININKDEGNQDNTTDNQNISEVDYTINKDNFEVNIEHTNEEKIPDLKEIQNNEDIGKNNKNLNEGNKISGTDEEDKNKSDEDLNNDNKIDKYRKDLHVVNQDNVNVNKDSNVILESNEDLNEDNNFINRINGDLNEDLNSDCENVVKGNENFHADNTVVIKDNVAAIEDVSSFEDNEDIEEIATGSNIEVTNKINEFIGRNNESLTKDNEISARDKFLKIATEFLTKDKQLNTDTERSVEGDQTLNKDIHCSSKNNESPTEDYQSPNTDFQSLNKDEESLDIDYQFPNMNCPSSNEEGQFSQEENQPPNNDYQSTNTQSLIKDKSSKDMGFSEKDISCSERSELPKENIQYSGKNEFSNKNSEYTNQNNKSPINEDNFQGEEKNLVEAEENSKEETVNDFNALEDLKAKMSRTFKSLAKRMEATTTTLQQECSKSLPMLKDISKNVENGSSKFPLNEIRTRTRQRRRRRNDNNWHKMTKSSENVNIYENINFQKSRLKEKSLFDDDSSNSSETINYRQDNSLVENIRLQENKFKDDFALNEKIDITQPPPPLARIPQHILKSHSISETQTGRMRKRKQSRIAFNGPLNYEETILDFKCHICSKLIDSSWPVLKAHFDIWHPDEYTVAELNPLLLKISSDYIDGGYKEILSKKYKCDSSPRKRKRRSRFTQKSPEKIDQSAGICVTAESVLEDDGMFKCKKCDVKFSDMDNLRQHISKIHRIKGRYLVCLECGENFVVAPSLQMHLKAFHAIDDPLTYLLQNTAFAPENLEDTEEEEEEVTTDENQCYVCMAVFEDKAAVDKHLRVHGMAFLNRKRMEAKKNLNNSEKKLKMTTQTDDARCGNTSISLNPTKHQDDKQIKLLTTNSETEVSVH